MSKITEQELIDKIINRVLEFTGKYISPKEVILILTLIKKALPELAKEACNASHAVGFRDGVIKGREGYVKLADLNK